MARTQQRGVSGTTIGLIVFAGLFLTSTVFLVILYTDQEKLRQESADYKLRKERAVSASEETSIASLRSGQGGGSTTMVGIIEASRAETARLATGAVDDEPPAIQTKLSTLQERMATESIVPDGRQFADLSLYQSLDRLYELFRTEHGLRLEAEKRAASIEQQHGQAVTENTSQKTGFDEQVNALQAKLSDCQASRDSFESEHKTQLADLEKQFNELRADMNKSISDERQQKSAMQERYAELLHRYTELQGKLGSLQVSPDVNVTARQADGRILKAVAGDEAVYVNLGARDALVLGMQFAVYSSDTGIPADGHAKAQIRVEAIHEASAECKVLRVYRNESILEGDLIANPVYDRQRPLSFVVAGDFDINRDGDTDPSGEMPVESIVKDWGGEVSNELTALTDFVVIGIAPKGGKVAAGNNPADVTEKDKAAQMRRDRYDKIIENARTLSVPVLTQDVFLHFLGYAGKERTASMR